MHIALLDLGLAKLFVVYPGAESYLLDDRTFATVYQKKLIGCKTTSSGLVSDDVLLHV